MDALDGLKFVYDSIFGIFCSFAKRRIVWLSVKKSELETDVLMCYML